MDLKQAHILVTATSYGKNDTRLKTELEAQVASVTYNPTGKPLSSAELAEILKGKDGLIAGLDVIDAAALAGADQLKVISRYGVGYDNVDHAYARSRGIPVANVPDYGTEEVADSAIGLMLALTRAS